jgi:hypothetical protein
MQWNSEELNLPAGLVGRNKTTKGQFAGQSPFCVRKKGFSVLPGVHSGIISLFIGIRVWQERSKSILRMPDFFVTKDD